MMQQQSKVLASAARHSRSEAVRRAVRIALHVMTPATLLAMSAGPAMAGPQDGTVVRGAASIESPAANVVNINQTTDRAVINWRSFSIGADEQVNFNQPSSASATLNRVFGGQRSVIEGALSANGQVFLLNSSGVLFSPSAQVDVGGLVATTSTIRDADFMAGDLKFVASGQARGEIANEGTITIRDGGMAALVAPTVRNQGIISARLGRIALGAGETFTLDLYGDQLINFALPDASGSGSPARGIDQAGSLIADGGQVLLTTDAAAGIVGGVVNMSGIVQAHTVEQNARGEIVLAGGGAAVDVSGRLDASGRDTGSQGGSIDVLGQSVNLSSSAVVDATGVSGGGAVRIGGGFATDNTPRADTTIVTEGATIDVSATDAGNAGTVAVWGNDSAQFAGTIRARGGEHGGDGGFVEVSSKGLLQFLGDVSTVAPHGAAGTVLLDPQTIRIEAIGSNSPTASVIAASALNSMLRQGTSVILQADDSITVNAALDGRPLDGSAQPSGGVHLTAGSILVLQPIVTSNNSIQLTATGGEISFGAQGYLYVANGAGVGTAAIAVQAAGSVTTDAAQTPNAGHLISLGAISITAQTGDVRLATGLYGLSQMGSASRIGSLDIVAGRDVSLAGAATASGNIEVTAGRNITNSGNSIVSSGDVTLRAGDSITLNAGSGATGLAASGDVSMFAGTAVTLNASVVASGGNLRIGAAGSQVGSLAMGAGAALFTEGAAADADGIEIFAVGDVTLRGASSSGDIRVNTGTAGSIVLSDRSIAAADDIDMTAGGALTLAAIGPVESIATGVDAGDDVSLGAGLGVTLNSSVRARGASLEIGTAGPGGQVQSLTMGSGASLFVEGTVQGADEGVQVHAAGDVTLRGVSSTGAIRVDAGGSIHNSERALVAGDDVELLAGEGLTLTRIGANTVETGISGDQVTLRAAGEIALDSSVAANGVGLTLGGLTPGSGAAAIFMGSGAGLFVSGAGETDPGLQVDATGDIVTRGAASSGDLRLTSSAGDVRNLDRSLTAGDTITLAAAQDVTLGAVLENQQHRAGLSAGNGITVAAGDTVMLDTDVDAGAGDVSIGSADDPVGVLDMNPRRAIRASGTGALRIFGDELTTGSLVAGTGGVVLRVNAGQQVNVLGPILSGGPVLIGAQEAVTSGENALVNLSNSIFTTGDSVTINGDVTLFEGISQWDIERALGEDVPMEWTTGAYVDPALFNRAALGFSDGTLETEAICDNTTACTAETRDLLVRLCADSDNCRVGSRPTGDPDQPLLLFFEIDLIEGLRFIGIEDTMDARAQDGSLLRSGWITGLPLGEAFTEETILPQIPLAAERERRWQILLGRLTSTIDTTDAGANDGAPITVNGSLERYSPFDENGPTAPGTTGIYPSFVGHGLVATAGTGTVTFGGAIGDVASDAARTGIDPTVLIPQVRENPLMPLLGTFAVFIDAANVTLCGDGCNADRFVNTWTSSVGAPVDGPNVIPLTYRIDVAWTQSDKGALATPPEVSVPDVLPVPTFVPSTDLDDFDPGDGTDLGQGTPQVGNGLTAGGPVNDADVATTREAEQHRDSEDAANTDAPADQSTEEDTCPQGAGASADLGTYRSVDGAAPDVFARCEDAG